MQQQGAIVYALMRLASAVPTLLLVIGCVVFATTTMATLWVGYILLQQAWLTENPELSSEADEIRVLAAKPSKTQPGAPE